MDRLAATANCHVPVASLDRPVVRPDLTVRFRRNLTADPGLFRESSSHDGIDDIRHSVEQLLLVGRGVPERARDANRDLNLIWAGDVNCHGRSCLISWRDLEDHSMPIICGLLGNVRRLGSDVVR